MSGSEPLAFLNGDDDRSETNTLMAEMPDPNEPVIVRVASSQGECELLLSVLRGGGIECMSRMTNRAAGIGDGLGTWGPQEVLVRQRDAEAARELLSQDDAAP